MCFAPAEDARPGSGTVRLEFSLRPSYRPHRRRRDGSVDAHQRGLATGPGPRARLRPVHGTARKAPADRVVVDVLDVIHFLPAHARFRAVAHGRSLPGVSPSAVFALSMAGGERRVKRTDSHGNAIRASRNGPRSRDGRYRSQPFPAKALLACMPPNRLPTVSDQQRKLK